MIESTTEISDLFLSITRDVRNPIISSKTKSIFSFYNCIDAFLVFISNNNIKRLGFLLCFLFKKHVNFCFSDLFAHLIRLKAFPIVCLHAIYKFDVNKIL